MCEGLLLARMNMTQQDPTNPQPPPRHTPRRSHLAGLLATLMTKMHLTEMMLPCRLTRRPLPPRHGQASGEALQPVSSWSSCPSVL